MTEAVSKAEWLQTNFLKKPYRVHALLFIFYIAYGFIWQSPRGIFDGMVTILTVSNILVTDYIAVANLGATFVNVGIMGLLAIWVLSATRHRPFGLDMGVLGLVTGFAFFGKNPLNMLPILIGAYLFSKFSKRPFEENVVPALLGNALAPAVSQLVHVDHIPIPVGIVLGAVIGIFIGFTISPLAVWMRRAHEGYNLYNIGFTAGLFALSLMALYRNLGIDFYLRNYWSSGYNAQLMIYLAVISIYFIVIGLLTKTDQKVSLKQLMLMKTEDFDYFKAFREKSYIAMGILGLAYLIFMFAIGAEYNGLAIGAILSIIGFGAFGKTLLSALPIALGTVAANVLNYFTLSAYSDLTFWESFNTPGAIVAILFSTCLCPLAKTFGWKWGFIAGFMHLSLATNIGIFHGGMNLYNNGLAGGIVAMVLLPVIRAFNRRKEAAKA